MIIAHLFVDEDPMRRVQLEMVPRVGDEVRIDHTTFATVAKVVWCLDEWCHGAQRVNIGLLREES